MTTHTLVDAPTPVDMADNVRLWKPVADVPCPVRVDMDNCAAERLALAEGLAAGRELHERVPPGVSHLVRLYVSESLRKCIHKRSLG